MKLDEARNMSDRWQTKRYLYVYNTHESLIRNGYKSMLRSMRAAPGEIVRVRSSPLQVSGKVQL